MRVLTILLIVIGLMGCAKPQIIEKQFAPDKIIHMSKSHLLKDAANLDQFVFYLNEGDTLPLKLKAKSDLIGFSQEQVDVVIKKKIFFRMEKGEDVTQADLEKIFAMTPDQITEMTPKQMEDLTKKIQLFISLNGTSWATLTDSKTVKEILGIERGEFSFGMAISGDEGLWFLFSLKMHERASFNSKN